MQDKNLTVIQSIQNNFNEWSENKETRDNTHTIYWYKLNISVTARGSESDTKLWGCWEHNAGKIKERTITEATIDSWKKQLGQVSLCGRRRNYGPIEWNAILCNW